MWILPLIGYAGVIVGFAFLTLAIASGLYYLSELVEEHTVIARRILSRLIYGVIIAQILLWLLDSFPLTLSVLSIFSHLVYASNLRKFPIVKLSDPLFILSCFLVCLNHWVWFRHFSDPAALSSRRSFSSTSSRDATAWRRPYQPDYENMPTFTEVASYFGLCVWLVPFALFVSLSAGDNVLPSMGSEYATGGNAHPSSSSSSSALPEGGRNKNIGLAKALVDRVREWASESGELLGFYKGDRTRRFL